MGERTLVNTHRDLGRMFQELQKHQVIGCDTETTGLLWQTLDVPVGASFAVKGKSWYVELQWGEPRPKAGTFDFDAKTDPRTEIQLEDLREIFAMKKTWVFHNAPFDIHMLGFELGGVVEDTMLMLALLDPDRLKKKDHPQRKGLGLKDAAAEFLKIHTDEDRVLGEYLDKNKLRRDSIYCVPASILYPYACADAEYTRALYYKFATAIKRRKMENVHIMERNVQACTIKMEERGMEIDMEYFKGVRSRLEAEIDELDERIQSIMVGVENPNSNEQLMAWLKEQGIYLPNVQADTLHKCKHEIGQLIPERRTKAKFLDTYVNNLLNRSYNRRIYAQIKSLGARTGRMACVVPDTPIRTLRGDIRADSVRVGDYVLTHKGRWRMVEKAWCKGYEDTVTVHFDSGDEITCTRSHRMLTSDGRWVTVQELMDECVEIVDDGCDERAQCGGAVPEQGISVDGGDCAKVGNHVPQRAACGEGADTGGRTQGAQGDSVLAVEDGRQEPHEGEDGRTASQLEGAVRGRVRVPDVSVPWPEEVGAPRGGCADAWDTGVAASVCGAPYRWGQNEQRRGELGYRYKRGSQATALLAVEGQPCRQVEEIHVGRSRPIYDFTVAQDHSYYAGGVFNHNSAEPNLQNLPARASDLIRKGFIITKPGWQLLYMDYSQIEVVVFAEISGDERLQQAIIDGLDVHRLVASWMFDVEYDAVEDKQRKVAKAMTFGILFGQGIALTAESLGVTEHQARKFQERYFHTLPAVRRVQRQLQDLTRSRKYSRTLFGRIRPITDSEKAYIGINSTVQGSAADIMKIAIPRMEHFLQANGYESQLLMPIHDEVIVEHKIDEPIIPALAKLMTKGFPLKMPMRVGVEYTTTNWAEKKKLDDRENLGRLLETERFKGMLDRAVDWDKVGASGLGIATPYFRELLWIVREPSGQDRLELVA